MRKKQMSPLNVIRKGTVNNQPQKDIAPPAPAMAAARGGASNSINDYAKATPMASPAGSPPA